MYEQLLESTREKVGKEKVKDKDDEETQSTQGSSDESLSSSASMILVEKGNYPKQFLVRTI